MNKHVAWTFPNGDRITIVRTDTGVIVRGSGARLGKLAVMPVGGNQIEVEVVE